MTRILYVHGYSSSGWGPCRVRDAILRVEQPPRGRADRKRRVSGGSSGTSNGECRAGILALQCPNLRRKRP